jgi:branched-chain amino acid transport system permease protein
VVSDFLSVLAFGVLLGGIYGLVGIGLNLIFGVVRILNFAHGELIMISMYGTYYVHATLGLDPYLALLLVAPALFLVGVLIQRVIMQPLQTEPMMQMFATFGLLMILQNLVLATTRGVALNVNSPIGAQILTVGDVRLSAPRLIIFAAMTLLTVALQIFLNRTIAGKAIRAVTQDRRAARVVGINVERTYVLVFGAGAALTGIAGALLAPIYTLSPSIGQDFIFAAFAVVVLGGLGSLWGAYIGGLVIGLTEAMAGYYIDPALKTAVWFTIFIVVLIVRPSGLLGRAGAAEVGFRG